jgi:hypothetical protein
MADDRVRWPGDTYDAEGSDLGDPLVSLLEQISLIEDPSKEVTAFKTPDSVQVIRAGATAMSKGWATFIAAGGVGATIVAALQVEWNTAGDTVRVAFMIGMAILLAAISLSIAIIVRADVTSRGRASAARIEARSRFAAEFVGLTSQQQLERRRREELLNVIRAAQKELGKAA